MPERVRNKSLPWSEKGSGEEQSSCCSIPRRLCQTVENTGGSSAEERKPLPVAICSLLLLVITTKPLARCLFSLPSLRGGRNSYEQANGVCKPLTRGRL